MSTVVLHVFLSRTSLSGLVQFWRHCTTYACMLFPNCTRNHAIILILRTPTFEKILLIYSLPKNNGQLFGRSQSCYWACFSTNIKASFVTGILKVVYFKISICYTDQKQHSDMISTVDRKPPLKMINILVRKHNCVFFSLFFAARTCAVESTE